MKSIIYKLQLHRFLFDFGSNIVDIFSTIFIFSKTDNLIYVLTFKAIETIFIPVGSIISSILINKVSFKLTLIFGILGYILQPLILIFLQNNLENLILILGIITGISVGLRALSLNVIFQNTISDELKGFYSGISGSIDGFRSLLFPIFSTLVYIISDSYLVLFVFSLIFFTLSILPIIIFKTKNKKSKIELPKAFIKQISIPDLRQINLVWFIHGIRSSIFRSIWSIITITIVGGITNWGKFTFGIAILSIILSYTIGKKINFNISRGILALFSLIYFIASVFLAINFNFMYFVIFSIILAVFDSGFWNSINLLRSSVYSLYADKDNMDEYHALAEIPLAFGRLIPLIILISFNTKNIESEIMKIIILIIGIIPFFMFLEMKKISFIKNNGYF